MVKEIEKRDGTVVGFDSSKIAAAVMKAFQATQECVNVSDAVAKVTTSVVKKINETGKETVEIEEVQDLVESKLMALGWTQTAKAYILYRDKRQKSRDRNSRLMLTFDQMVKEDAEVNNILRENANVDGNTAMGTMLKFGSEAAKSYTLLKQLRPDIAAAHENGDIHIHDLDFYSTRTTTCSQIDLDHLFENGFNTGHGYLRKPNSIMSYSALTCIAIQANQNEQHGGQSIPNFDKMLANGVKCTFKKQLQKTLSVMLSIVNSAKSAKEILDEVASAMSIDLSNADKIAAKINEITSLDVKKVVDMAIEATDGETYQAMESLIHNLNTMNSRAGAQVPFSSINYGTDTSPEGRMIVKNLLLATEAGLGNGETPIFPIQIFRIKEGVNYNQNDPNYDLFKLACRVSAKRLFPNFSFQDAPFNLQYYKKGKPETEIAYMGCRTRVIGNVNGPEISYSRGNLSFTSINLPRIGIEAKGDWNVFYQKLDNMLQVVKEQLLERLEYQSKAKQKNFPFLMREGIWLGAENLNPNDSVADILKNGTLSIGFIGLAECLKAMMNVHHGESEEAQQKGLEIIKHMRSFVDKAAEQTHLNFSLLATPAEGLSGRFVKIDREKYGEIKGVTDRDYYTNSFHVPVYYNIGAFDKIKKEAPYHALTNGGHISYIELDGDPTNNLNAFEKIIVAMKEAGIGYGAINHPVDRDPVCGYSGIIGDTCPKCHRTEYKDNNGNYNGIPFDRIRRITGYLVGSLDRFNNGKRAEEKDRVKHSL